MENSAWRSRARLVAKAQMIYYSVEAIWFILTVGIGQVLIRAFHKFMCSSCKETCTALVDEANIPHDILDIILSYVSTTMLIIVPIGIILDLIQISAAEKVFQVTKTGKPAFKALNWTMLWCCLMFADLIISIPVLIFISPLIIALKCFFLYIAAEYLKELQFLIAQNPTVPNM